MTSAEARDGGTPQERAPGLLVIVSAPSGAGKTSLVNALLDRDKQLAVAISHTTRPQRPGEVDGTNYHFIDAAQFEGMVEQGAFLEHAQVFGNRYGTSRAAVHSVWQTGRDVVLEIDWQGAAQIQESFRATVSVFILPPSKRALRERLTGRGQDKADVIDARMATAISEMSHYSAYDYLLINDEFDVALDELQAIVRAERLRQERQQVRHGDLLQQLLAGD